MSKLITVIYEDSTSKIGAYISDVDRYLGGNRSTRSNRYKRTSSTVEPNLYDAFRRPSSRVKPKNAVVRKCNLSLFSDQPVKKLSHMDDTIMKSCPDSIPVLPTNDYDVAYSINKIQGGDSHNNVNTSDSSSDALSDDA